MKGYDGTDRMDRTNTIKAGVRKQLALNLLALIVLRNVETPMIHAIYYKIMPEPELLVPHYRI